jgi:glutamate-5-semialdehyde dehydrogenase
MSIEDQINSIGIQARAASLELAVCETKRKNDVLTTLAKMLLLNTEEILKENALDLEEGEQGGLSAAFMDRLKLTPERIEAMAAGLKQVAALPDPVGEEIEKLSPENGLDIRKIRVPFGVIGIIYESRPNVTIDCAALCLKSGNAAILRGGKESMHTNLILAEFISKALLENRVNKHAVQLIPTTDRAALNYMLKLDQFIHCIIPRGGEGLIRHVVENSTIPVIKHYKGICNIYIDRVVDFDLARKIVVNAKCQRPGVCNAVENLFVHKDVASEFLPLIADNLRKEGVELRGDDTVTPFIKDLVPATEEDYHTEYLDLILSIRVVDDIHIAMREINTYGSGHSDAIISNDEDAARRFMAGVDAAAVYWNASTRFTDGYEFGLGAEIGISTDKLHARGPMGLKELCSYKYLVFGHGQVRK